MTQVQAQRRASKPRKPKATLTTDRPHLPSPSETGNHGRRGRCGCCSRAREILRRRPGAPAGGGDPEVGSSGVAAPPDRRHRCSPGTETRSSATWSRTSVTASWCTSTSRTRRKGSAWPNAALDITFKGKRREWIIVALEEDSSSYSSSTPSNGWASIADQTDGATGGSTAGPTSWSCPRTAGWCRPKAPPSRDAPALARALGRGDRP